MAQLLDEIQWDEPILPVMADAAWEAEVKRALGSVPDVLRRIAPSPWLRRAFLHIDLYSPTHLPARLVHIGTLVTAQENACRYCYGAARAQMTMLGYSNRLINQLERETQLAELDERERAVISFCRALARSSPRPARADLESLVRLGYSPQQVHELAFLIVLGCFANRVATLVACPPEARFEMLAGTLLGRLMGLAAPLTRALGALRNRGAAAPAPALAPTGSGIFQPLMHALGDAQAARLIQDTLADAFEDSVLPRRTKALMFAVVARALNCTVCGEESRRLLQGEDFDDHAVEACLAALASPRLEPYESRVIAWVRDTVRYEPHQIQRRTRALLAEVGPAALLDAVGVAALANAVVRLAMVVK